MRRRGGFTLVEAMVTIAIIAVVAAVAAPAVLKSMPGLRANGAARQVLSDFRLARTKAIDRGQRVKFEFLPGDTYRVFVDVNNDGVYDGDPRNLVTTVDIGGSGYYQGISYGVAAAAIPVPTDAITTSIFFRPNGSVSTEGAVYLNAGTAEDLHRRVRILAATGNARTQRWEGAWN